MGIFLVGTTIFIAPYAKIATFFELPSYFHFITKYNGNVKNEETG